MKNEHIDERLVRKAKEEIDRRNGRGPEMVSNHTVFFERVDKLRGEKRKKQ